jgi:hypothetical protein
MADEEPKGTPDEPDLDPLQTLQGVWHPLRLVLAGSAIVVGVFMSSCGTFLAVSSLAQTPLGANSRSAPGLVVAHKRSASRSRTVRYVYAPVVRFTADGRDFEITSRLATNTPPTVGQHVQVRYDAATPERAVVVGWAEWGMPVEWMVIGGALLAAGIYMWRRRWWRRPDSWW